MDMRTRNLQMRKAVDWLDKLVRDGLADCAPVCNRRLGYAAYCGYVYVIKRESKPKLWFIVNMDQDSEYKNMSSIKRICV